MAGDKTNIILIGMAGSGKSAVGRRLAEMLHLAFVDTDDLIVKAQGSPLQVILDRLGPAGFRRIEEKILLALDVRGHVIATGGSTVYSAAGMAHLRNIGLVVLLQVELAILAARVGSAATRGLVRRPEQTFAQLYAERFPLYRKYADLVYDCADQDIESVCRGLIPLLPAITTTRPETS